MSTCVNRSVAALRPLFSGRHLIELTAILLGYQAALAVGTSVTWAHLSENPLATNVASSPTQYLVPAAAALALVAFLAKRHISAAVFAAVAALLHIPDVVSNGFAPVSSAATALSILVFSTVIALITIAAVRSKANDLTPQVRRNLIIGTVIAAAVLSCNVVNVRYIVIPITNGFGNGPSQWHLVALSIAQSWSTPPSYWRLP